MKAKLFYLGMLLILGILWGGLNPNPGRVFAEETGKDSPQNNGLLNRIDFGNSYIMGQSIKSGAVYLMHRKKSDIKSMLKSRENYREEILENLKVAGSELDSKEPETRK